jgi:hypothetical protein
MIKKTETKPAIKACAKSALGLRKLKVTTPPIHVPGGNPPIPEEPPKQTAPTYEELKAIRSQIASGVRVALFQDYKVVLKGVKLELGWADGATIQDGIERLWDVSRIATEPVPYDEAKPGEYIVRVRDNVKLSADKTGPRIDLYTKRAVKEQDNRKPPIDVVIKWINDGKPCGYRYGFSWKGAGTSRISTGDAKKRLVSRNYFEYEFEVIGDNRETALVFVNYSASDLE